MATYSFPSVSPTTSSIQLMSNTATFTSVFTGATQTLDRGGERWAITMQFNNLKGDDVGVLTAFVARLNGQQHRFTVKNYADPARGSKGGTPLVAGAAQTGTSLTIDGASTSQTNWLRAGDFFSVNGELKMCVTDTNTDVGGNATINFIPRLRTAPADNAPLTLTDATGTFMLSNNGVAWSNAPGGFTTLTIECMEDIT